MIPASGHCTLIKMPARFGLLQWPSGTDEVGTLGVRREITLHLSQTDVRKQQMDLLKDWCEALPGSCSVHYHHSTGFPRCTAKCSCALGGEAELSLELHSSGLNCTDSSYLVKMGLLFTFQTALGFNPGKIAGSKPSPALFILQKIAHFSTQPYFKG